MRVPVLTAAICSAVLNGHVAVAQDYTLTLTGQCPGRICMEWSGATPNHRQGVVIASRLGRTIIPTGGCAGTELGIQDNLWLVYVIGTESGEGKRYGNAGSHPCGWQMQLVESRTCRVSNTAQFP